MVIGGFGEVRIVSGEGKKGEGLADSEIKIYTLVAFSGCNCLAFHV
jgi:hypothetical protein